jgi:hypothetical protein
MEGYMRVEGELKHDEIEMEVHTGDKIGTDLKL